MPEQTTGLEHRYEVRKIDDPTGQHRACRYFVLDPQHDPIATEALRHYASRTPHTALRRDLHDWLDSLTEDDRDEILPPFPARERHTDPCPGCGHPLGIHADHIGCVHGWEHDLDGHSSREGCRCPLALAGDWRPPAERDLW